MASQTWPGSLPQGIRIPTQHDPGEQNLRTRMDAGPEKVRRRYTAVAEPFTTTLLMSGAQYKTLQNFYKTTLKGGSLRFDWESPVDDTTVEMRFKERPQGNIVSGGDSDARTWQVSLNLEIMP